jgi:hypothetical protein
MEIFATDFFNHRFHSTQYVNTRIKKAESGRVGLAPPLLLIFMIGINTRTRKAEPYKLGLSFLE